MNVCIIGTGNIGSAIYDGITLQSNGYHHDNVTTCDLKEYKSGVWKRTIKDADVNIICLPADNLGGDQDMSTINEYLEHLFMEKTNNRQSLVFICSTVLPWSIEQKYYDFLNIIFWPQFMNERNAVKEFKETDFVVLGGDSIVQLKKAQYFISTTFQMNNPKFELTSLKYAALFKYFRNLKMSYNVMFWNYIFEFAESFSFDYRKIREIFGFDYRKIREMMENNPVGECSNVAADGYLGIGGICLPKDMKALENSFPHELTRALEEFNLRIRKD